MGGHVESLGCIIVQSLYITEIARAYKTRPGRGIKKYVCVSHF